MLDGSSPIRRVSRDRRDLPVVTWGGSCRCDGDAADALATVLSDLPPATGRSLAGAPDEVW